MKKYIFLVLIAVFVISCEKDDMEQQKHGSTLKFLPFDSRIIGKWKAVQDEINPSVYIFNEDRTAILINDVRNFARKKDTLNFEYFRLSVDYYYDGTTNWRDTVSGVCVYENRTDTLGQYPGFIPLQIINSDTIEIYFRKHYREKV